MYMWHLIIVFVDVMLYQSPSCAHFYLYINVGPIFPSFWGKLCDIFFFFFYRWAIIGGTFVWDVCISGFLYYVSSVSIYFSGAYLSVSSVSIWDVVIYIYRFFCIMYQVYLFFFSKYVSKTKKHMSWYKKRCIMYKVKTKLNLAVYSFFLYKIMTHY